MNAERNAARKRLCDCSLLRDLPEHRALIVCASILLACSCAAAEPSRRADRARTTHSGTPLASLFKTAGAPTIERAVKNGTYPVDPCAYDQQNVRALEYHVTYDAVTRSVLKLFDRPAVLSMTVVCVNGDANVTSTHGRMVN
jgi:hypothetical protein